jgi:hypothetical protein
VLVIFNSLILNFTFMRKAHVYQQLREYFQHKPIRKVSILDQTPEVTEVPVSQTVIVFIEPEHSLTLSTLSRYQWELEHLHGIKTDMGTESGLSPRILSLICNDIDVVLSK